MLNYRGFPLTLAFITVLELYRGEIIDIAPQIYRDFYLLCCFMSNVISLVDHREILGVLLE